MGAEILSRLPRRTVIEGPSNIHRKGASMGFSRPHRKPSRILVDGCFLPGRRWAHTDAPCWHARELPTSTAHRWSTCRDRESGKGLGLTEENHLGQALCQARPVDAAWLSSDAPRCLLRVTTSKNLQPFSQKSRTPTVAKEIQIGLYHPAEADLELFRNSWSAGFRENGCTCKKQPIRNSALPDTTKSTSMQCPGLRHIGPFCGPP